MKWNKEDVGFTMRRMGLVILWSWIFISLMYIGILKTVPYIMELDILEYLRISLATITIVTTVYAMVAVTVCLFEKEIEKEVKEFMK